MEDLLNRQIRFLGLTIQLENKLLDNNINLIYDLWILKSSNLKKFLNDREISDIIIKLQLHGLDLNKKVYKINWLINIDVLYILWVALWINLV